MTELDWPGEEVFCDGIVRGPFAGLCLPPLATFPARVARNSASRNSLSLQNLRFYQRHRRQSPRTGPLSPPGYHRLVNCYFAAGDTSVGFRPKCLEFGHAKVATAFAPLQPACERSRRARPSTINS